MTSPKWVNALTDDSIGLNTHSGCVGLADFAGDGEVKLIVADLGTSKINLKMKVFKGVQKINELVLAEPPTALVTFVNEQISVPSIGVACGPSIYVYKGLKPFYKFDTPALPVNEIEMEAWRKLSQGEISPDELVNVLTVLKDEMSAKNLSPQSQRVLACAPQDQRVAITTLSAKQPVNRSPITCCVSMKKGQGDSSPIDVLIIGCEDGHVYVADTQAFQITVSNHLGGTPVFIASHGSYDVEYRIFVSTREGHVYALKRETANQKIDKPIITCKAYVIGMVTFGKLLAVACTDRTLTYYSHKGKRVNQFVLPEKIVGIECFFYAPKQYNGVIVALQKEFRIYTEAGMVDQVRTDAYLKWLKFGPFGREEAALILGTQNGGLIAKLFRRVATLDEVIGTSIPRLPHQVKLNLPKKTKQFIDQTLRERENPTQMHQNYQRDLFMLRWLVNKQFVDATKNALSSISSDGEVVDISVDVNGFGPTFRLTVKLTAGTKTPLYSMYLSFVGNPASFRFETSLIPVAILTPGHFYTFTTFVEALTPEKGIAEDIKIFLFRPDKATPIVTAIVTMPISEMSLLD